MTLSEKLGQQTIQRKRNLERMHEQRRGERARNRLYAIVTGGVDAMNLQRAMKRLRRRKRQERPS